MAEANIFFLPAREFCRREVVTCPPDARIDEVARTMSGRSISSVVVCERGEPVGIITDRDLRNKVVAAGADPRLLAAREVMNSPLIVVGEDEYLFEVMYLMSRHGIHRVGVVDGEGRLAGIVTDSDLLRLQVRSPQQLVRDVEEAGSLDELRAVHDEITDLVVDLARTGVRTRDLVKLVSHLNDQIQLRWIALLRRDRFPELPERMAFLVMGSEGRREQTLKTDQDNALVYADDLTPEEVGRVEAFSRELVDGLIAIGIPECPGGIMAKTEMWRRSEGGWAEALDRWLASSTPEHLLNCSMFADLRTLWGDPGLEAALRAHVAGRLQQDATFTALLAANALRFPPPLSWLGKVKVERSGEHRGSFDVKKAGIFAITDGVKALALASGEWAGGTRERIARLRGAGVLPGGVADDLEASFNFLVFLRLRAQVEVVAEGGTPTNYVDPTFLNRLETGRLRLALEGVRSFQSFLRVHFQLDMIRR